MSMQYCLAASYDLRIYILDLLSGQVTGNFELGNCQANRLYVKDSQFFASGYSYVFIYDINSKNSKPNQILLAHDSNVNDILCRENSLYTSGEDKLIKIWDMRDLKSQRCIHVNECVSSIALMKNDNYLISGSEDGNIYCWDVRNLQKVGFSTPLVSQFTDSTTLFSEKTPVVSLSSIPQKSSFISLLMNGTAISYHIDQGNIVENFRINALSDTATRCRVSPDEFYFSTCGANLTTRIFKVEDGTLLHEISSTSSESYKWIMDNVFTSDSSNLITGDSQGQIKVWNVKSGELILSMQKLEKSISAIDIINS